MEEILQQLVDGLSHSNPIICCFIVTNSYQLVQDFFHPQYHGHVVSSGNHDMWWVRGIIPKWLQVSGQWILVIYPYV